MTDIGNLGVDVAPKEDFSPFAPGEYPAVITSSEKKANKRKGHRLEMTFEITEGPAKGRKVWVNLNLWNDSEKAVEIAQRELRAIREATGQMGATQAEEMHYKPLIIRVDIEQDEGYSPRNVIKAYKPAGGAAGNASVSSGAQTSPTTTSPSSGAAPWGRAA